MTNPKWFKLNFSYVALTEDLSTLDAELAHFTNANNRINNCLVLAEKL